MLEQLLPADMGREIIVINGEKGKCKVQIQNGSFKVYRGRVFTIAEVSCEVNGERFYGEGIARRSSRDKDNFKLACEISVGRALKAIKRKIKKKCVQHNFMG